MSYIDFYGDSAKRFLKEQFGRVVNAVEGADKGIIGAINNLTAAVKENTAEVKQLREELSPKTLNKSAPKPLK